MAREGEQKKMRRRSERRPRSAARTSRKGGDSGIEVIECICMCSQSVVDHSKKTKDRVERKENKDAKRIEPTKKKTDELNKVR